MKKSEVERLCNRYLYYANLKNTYLCQSLSCDYSFNVFDNLHDYNHGVCDGILCCFDMLDIDYYILLDDSSTYEFIKGIEIEEYGIKKFISSDDSNQNFKKGVF